MEVLPSASVAWAITPRASRPARGTCHRAGRPAALCLLTEHDGAGRPVRATDAHPRIGLEVGEAREGEAHHFAVEHVRTRRRARAARVVELQEGEAHDVE